MKISELGEFELIDLLAGMVKAAENKDTDAQRQLVIGIGDDAAAWRGDDSIQLATVDALVQDVHFTLDTTSWVELGWKALAVNLSDIAAMGGLPRYALVSLALPGQTEVEQVTELYRGMISLAQQFEVAIIGGNMSSAPLVVINITVLGTTGSHDAPLLTRSAAKPGEKVAVTGYPGKAAAGLEMLSNGLPIKPEQAESLKTAFLTPFPRVKEGRLMEKYGVKAAIDISDGLFADLRHICHMSKVGARIELDRLPVHPAVKAAFPGKAVEFALSGGEDYELLFTSSESIINKLRAEIKIPITIIGEVTAENAGEIELVDAKGNPIVTQAMGWDHFTGK
jgi:thiamine-monophosphate kinase